MKYNKLGTTDLMVSDLCLGTMTWGSQNTTEEGHAQIDMSLDHGINIIDTAEAYPVNPMSKETQGATERVIGEWLAKTGRRDDIILATKVAGEGASSVRNGEPISRATITQALHESLGRLRTDYIDLYQLHWPNRGSYMFRQNWAYDPTRQNKAETLAHMHEVLETLQEFVDAGKIRHVGLSNESAWGTAQWLRIAEDRSLPRMQSIQNEYSLLCRLFDTDLAELSHNEDVGLLAFSPLAVGLLTGKYQNGQIPPGSRRSLNDKLGGRVTDRVWPAVDAYLAIAAKHGLDPSQMALAWCNSRPFVTSSIFGATSIAQLETALGAADMVLDQAVLDDIAKAHKAHPMPY